MIIYSILLILSIFAGLFTGFYFGYLKAEKQVPYSINPISDIFKEISKPKDPEIEAEEEKENTFYK